MSRPHSDGPLARTVDDDDLDASIVARSRKVQKGEDFDLSVPALTWTPRRATGEDAPAVTFGLYGLFDGHGGKACASHCAETFAGEVTRGLDGDGALREDEDAGDAFERRIPEALRRAFKVVDETFIAMDVHSGSTATVCAVRGRMVTTAAVGDSLATLDLGPGIPVLRLSVEHRLDSSESERKRIEEAGGEVRPTEYEDGPNGERVGVGPLRVWPGGLAVSRSIGDRDGKKGGVISEPEVSMVLIPDRFHGARVVLASDGLWDAATPKQASACASKLNAQSAAAALNKLAQQQKDNRDDITVLVVDMLRDVGSKSGPFVVKPDHGGESAKLYFPFAKKAHDPFPLPSERREKRMHARLEAEARNAALEAARQIAEAEAEVERRRLEAEAAERFVDDDSWESTTKATKIKQVDRAPKVRGGNEKKHEKKQKQKNESVVPKRTPKPKTNDDAAPSAIGYKERNKRGKKQSDPPPMPDVSALDISDTKSDAESVSEKKKMVKKKKTKERLQTPVNTQPNAPMMDIPQSSVQAQSPATHTVLPAQHVPILHPYHPRPHVYPLVHGPPVGSHGMPGVYPHTMPMASNMPQFFGSPSMGPPGFSQLPHAMPGFPPRAGPPQQLAALMRSVSAPVPPGVPPGVPPQTMAHGSKAQQSSNVDAPRTPVNGVEQTNTKPKKKTQRKGKRERMLERKRLENAQHSESTG